MNATYQANELETARTELNAARTRMNAAKAEWEAKSSPKARKAYRTACEQVEWLGNKVAFLTFAR